MRKEVPIWEKSNLTLEEAAVYSGIGINKLRKMTDREDCTFVLLIGTKRLIKRIITVGMETAVSLALICQRPKTANAKYR